MICSRKMSVPPARISVVKKKGNKMNKICCFCELELSDESLFCPNCMEYKGVMTITEFEKIYC